MLKPLIALSAFLFFGPQQPTAPQTPPAAAIPAEAAATPNPVHATPESLARARKMYGYDCALCHGVNGNGKGDLAGEMKPPLKDYTDPTALSGLSDGALFYIIKNGQGQMPGEGDRAKPAEIWNMVILVRSFAKK
jgi:mono/diheme cytochrome c family protein